MNKQFQQANCGRSHRPNSGHLPSDPLLFHRKILLKSADGKSIRPSRLDKEKSDFVQWLRFDGPFPEKAVFTLELPENLRDDAGRLLANASNYPLKVATDELPPLAKFPARFGILELNAEPVLPVTLRNLEAMVKARSAQPGKLGRTRSQHTGPGTP